MTEPITRIVCGVDLDDPAEAHAAIHWSHRLAVLTGADHHLVGTTTPVSIERSPDLLAELHRDALADLQSESDPQDVRIHLHTATGGLVDAVQSLAREVNPDVVVVSSHQTEGLTPLGLSGVGHTLAHRLAVPVVAVPEFAGLLRHRTVVVGVDGSPVSATALAWAKFLADAIEGRCCAVYSIAKIYDTFESGDWFGPDERTVRDVIEADADVELVERSGGDPAATLREVAEECDAGAVVVAARRRHSLGGTLLGAVPDHLLHHPRGPVVVLPYDFLTRFRSPAVAAEHG
ncbi:MAG: universal stress protein [Microthrixaceae bacterium]